ncbi:hypothetical protein N7508_005464 [Penicillium antarcticum]|uniref:uncharacterized protein n=1 Tax=Penicillium antarcticum TaxID=416450 RepID=UPI002399F3E9|nr:uncharacterized protein N7508_005464 [Penicillium antarcticum]KAJ5306449.1 hypothetical protein N7508_005464 [Penicillium antarcticum]
MRRTDMAFSNTMASNMLHIESEDIPINVASTQPVFQPTIWKSSTPLGEIDFLGHKSNATYLTDFDSARVYHLSSLFRLGYDKWKKEQDGVFPVLPVLAGVECSFKRPIKPGQRYDIVTRIIGWDLKWCFVVSYFVKEGVFQPGYFSDSKKRAKERVMGENGEEGDLEKGRCGEKHGDGKDVVLAVVMGRMVFKNGRKTISPVQFLSDCELIPAVGECGSPGSCTVVNSVGQSGADDGSGPSVNAIDQQMVIAKAIEEKRLKGLEIAQSINSLDDGVPFDAHEDVAFSKF